MFNEENLNDFKNSHNISSDKLNILFIGRLTDKSNINLLLDCLPEMKHKLQLFIVGTGADVEQLKVKCLKLGVSDQVVWLGPIYDEYKIAPWFLSTDCFVYPGAVGLSMIHAFSYGLPAIVHQEYSRHMPEIAAFEDGVTGYTFKYNSKNDFLSTLDKAFEQRKNMLPKMGLSAYDIVYKSFNVDVMAARFTEIIKAVKCAE